jgi:hypothetical protein
MIRVITELYQALGISELPAIEVARERGPYTKAQLLSALRAALDYAALLQLELDEERTARQRCSMPVPPQRISMDRLARA